MYGLRFFPKKLILRLFVQSENTHLSNRPMATQKRVFNLIILDESGSMESIKQPTISGFNELVQTIKAVEEKHPDQEHYIWLLTFNGLGTKMLLKNEPVSKLKELDAEKYQPASLTPLYDAMGEGLTKLRAHLADQSDYNVLVTILTDGEENRSKEYDGKAIKALVDDLKGKGWTFTYIGANHDVDKFASTISINNTMSFQATVEGTKAMFGKEKAARMRYSQKISRQEDVGSGFYDDDEKA